MNDAFQKIVFGSVQIQKGYKQAKNSKYKLTINQTKINKMPGGSKQVRGVCFTHNNFAEGDIERIIESFKTVAKYIIIGRETGASGTPHLQGYIKMKTQIRLKAATDKLTNCVGKAVHTEGAKGSAKQNKAYCSKEGDFVEWGEEVEQGKRTDIAAFIERASAVRSAEDEKALKDDMPGEWGKYYKAGRAAAKLDRKVEAFSSLKKEYEGGELREWQAKLLDRLEKQSSRKVTWCWEAEGNTGKTWMANWLATQKNAFLVEGGKVADIAHAFDCQEWVVFDLTRSSEEHSGYIYSVIESFKNGRIFSPKYDSGMKMFKPCTVVVFANWTPDRSALSEDRWDIVNVGTHPLWAAVKKTAEKRKLREMQEETMSDDEAEVKRMKL